MGNTQSIPGLPDGAVVKPIAAETRNVEGLPPGAQVRAVGGASQATSAPSNVTDQAQPQDPGLLHGMWESTLGPMFDEAKKNQDYIAQGSDWMDRMERRLSVAIKGTPPAMLAKMVSSAVHGAFEEGKKTASAGSEMLSHYKEAAKAAAKGDWQTAQSHGAEAARLQSEMTGHGIAAVTPLVGPAAAKAGEDIGAGKTKEGTGEGLGLISSVVGPELLSKGAGATVGNVVKKIKPGETTIAGETMPKLASQEQGASPLAAKVADIGSEPEFAKAQQQGSKKAIANIASDAAEKATKKLNKGVSSTVAPADFLKRVGADSGVIKTAGDQKIVDQYRQAFRDGKPVDPVKLSLDEDGNVIEADGRHRATAAQAEGIDRIPVNIERRAPMKVADFGEAAKAVENSAKPIYDKLNEASGGEFAKLRQERSAAYKARDFEKAKAAEQGIEDLFEKHTKEVTSSKILDEHGKPLTVAYEKNPVTGITKDELSNARQAWRDSYILQDVHEKVNNAFNIGDETIANKAGVWRGINGGKLMTGLNSLVKKVGRAEVERVIAPEGLQNLYRIADLTQSPQNAARYGNVISDVANELLPKRGLVGMVADEARRAVLNRAATNPKFAGRIEAAINAGASRGVYAPLLAREIQAQREQQEQK